MKRIEAFSAYDHSSSCEYRVRLLRGAAATRSGIVHRGADGEAILAWSRILSAVVATVGEPEGVNTVVFDLLVERDPSRLVVCRLAADPCGEALPLAVGLQAGLDPDRGDVSLEAMAREGSPREWYPDLEAFEAAARERFLKH